MDDRAYRFGYRALAPKVGGDPPAPNRVSEDNRNKRSSTACSECKQRRIKCRVDGSGPPCTECALHGRECIFDERQDKRRKVAREQIIEDLKRTQDELTYARGYLEYLLEAIRNGAPQDVYELVNAIRGGVADEQIPALISQITRISPKFDISHPSDGYSRYSQMLDGGQDDTPDGTPDGPDRRRR
ncbi:hypothetical protein BJY01DRAFT_243583 [Aspergillus pseudoustus]|uniref:Zn(2)-C6 fungal-type domain-containing protein n=1 Tax=Aspergillus pseudoustus TaxID=1810923 RepID=A0ABR4KQ96_9EURO